MYKYKIFGLNVESEFKISCYESEFDKTDVQVVFDQSLGDILDINRFQKIECNFTRFNMSGIGVFVILNGNEIRINKHPDIEIKMIELYLLGTAFGTLMIQRGDFPLHGSFVEKNGIGIALVGDSGAGKTTLAHAFSKVGWSIVTDDVMRLTFIDGQAYVYPSYPSQKIWRDSAMHLGLELDNTKNILNRMDKYYFDSEDIFSKEISKLEKIVEIVPIENSIDLIENKDVKVLDLLLRNSYRYNIVNSSGKVIEHFKYMSKLASMIKVQSIGRPKKLFTVNQQIELILKEF